MKIGLIVLSSDGFYLDSNNELPQRPNWDKQFLLDMCEDKVLLCSSNTMIGLPPSLFRTAKQITTDIEADYDINLGIDTFKSPVDLLIVTRSKWPISTRYGKAFNLDEYKKILTQGDIEIWKSIKS